MTAILLQAGSDISRLSINLPVLPKKEFIQKSAELVQTLLHFDTIASILLLYEAVSPAFKLFDGALFHTFLNMDVAGLVAGLAPQVQATFQQLIAQTTLST